MYRLLLVSKQSQYLLDFIQANTNPDTLIVDILDEENLLFSKLKEQSYALLVIDLNLLTRLFQTTLFYAQVTSINPQTAVLVIATTSQRVDAVEQLQHGAMDYILLPLLPKELLLKINRCLSFLPLRYTSLNDITPEIQTLQLDELLEIILSKTIQLTGAPLAKLWPADKDEKLTRHGSIEKSSLSTEEGMPDNILFPFAQDAARKKTVVFQQKTTVPRGSLHSLAAVILLPLMFNGKLIAVLLVGYKTEQTLWADQIYRLLNMCQQAAVIIENSRLFHELSVAHKDLAQSKENTLQSCNTLQAVLDGTTDGIYILNKDLTINALNQVEAKRQGCTPNDLIGKRFSLPDKPESTPQLINQIKKSLQSGQKSRWFSPQGDKALTTETREFRIYPIYNKNHQVDRVIVFAQNISMRQHNLSAIFKLANQAIAGQLAGSVAHQINNPLTVTMTNSQLLMLDFDRYTETHSLAKGIFNAGERIQGSLANLQEFSHQDQYNFVAVNLVDIIESTLTLVNSPLKKANIQLTKNFHLYPTIYASVSHLKLVWVNLLLNACDAVGNYAPAPQIIIETQALAKNSVRITFTDNGIGVPKKIAGQIFDPFFTTKTSNNALGLGLYTAQTIVEHHRGEIKVVSKPGNTTAEVILPLDSIPE